MEATSSSSCKDLVGSKTQTQTQTQLKAGRGSAHSHGAFAGFAAHARSSAPPMAGAAAPSELVRSMPMPLASPLFYRALDLAFAFLLIFRAAAFALVLVLAHAFALAFGIRIYALCQIADLAVTLKAFADLAVTLTATAFALALSNVVSRNRLGPSNLVEFLPMLRQVLQQCNPLCKPLRVRLLCILRSNCE